MTRPLCRRNYMYSILPLFRLHGCVRKIVLLFPTSGLAHRSRRRVFHHFDLYDQTNTYCTFVKLVCILPTLIIVRLSNVNSRPSIRVRVL